MTYDIYMVPLGVGCRAVWVASFLEEFFMRFTALQVVMLGRCGTGTDHQRSQNTMCREKLDGLWEVTKSGSNAFW